MAYVRQIQIAGYRSIQRLDVDLNPTDGQPFRHLILTGPNGSGKSSALELIHAAILDGRSGQFQSTHCRLTLTGPWIRRDQLVPFFQAQRLLQVQPVAGPTRIDWSDVLNSPGGAAGLATQYLVNRKTDQSFARDDGDQITVSAIENWFSELTTHLTSLFEDPGLSLQFDRKNYTFRVRYGDGREVAFTELAQGHSAVLNIVFELLIQSRAHKEVHGVDLQQLAGIVLIDEIETHLHLSLQELILPFLTDLFPTFQFIVATHSPAVIASIPDAVVYDLGKREAVASEDLQGVRYGTLMTHHFGIAADMDLDSTDKLTRLRELAGRPRSADEDGELASLAETLRGRSHTLTLEVWKALNPGPPAPKLRGVT